MRCCICFVYLDGSIEYAHLHRSMSNVCAMFILYQLTFHIDALFLFMNAILPPAPSKEKGCHCAQYIFKHTFPAGASFKTLSTACFSKISIPILVKNDKN